MPYAPTRLGFRRSVLPIAGVLVAAIGLRADTTYSETQAFPFNFSNSGGLPLAVASVGDFTATAQPFDPLLGTLVSFQIDWKVHFAASGTVIGSPSGSISSSSGGGYYLGGINYNGNGGGNGTGGPTGDPISFAFDVNRTDLFLASNAGVTYDPSLLSTVLGASPFALYFAGGYTVNGNGLDPVLASAVGDVTLTYNYVPETETSVGAAVVLAAIGGVMWRRRAVA
jgi:hypothetical protein